ncbi:hypothetical protein CXR04_16865 [Streptomyces sp. CMB-StM0423]|nr:hypothetical protein CXR04_16865 [Streptomyces sp. CMB-StM0423]
MGHGRRGHVGGCRGAGGDAAPATERGLNPRGTGNAMAESFFGTLKNERVSRVTYLAREAARRDITRYIEFWYNRERLHSAVGYRPPREVHAEHVKLRAVV